MVDSLHGKVWNMLNKEMTLAQQVASSVPFQRRTDPILLTDSSNALAVGRSQGSVKIDCHA